MTQALIYLFIGYLCLSMSKEVAKKTEDVRGKRLAYVITPVIVVAFLWHAFQVGTPLP